MAAEGDNALSMDQWDPSNIFEDCFHENDENDKNKGQYTVGGSGTGMTNEGYYYHSMVKQLPGRSNAVTNTISI